VILSFILSSLLGSTSIRIGAIAAMWLVYLAFLTFVRVRVYRRIDAFRNEDLLEADRRLGSNASRGGLVRSA
jgi:hypothetical protein